MCILQEKMSLHSVCACEFVFSNISSAPPRLRWVTVTSAFIHKNVPELLPIPPSPCLQPGTCTEHGARCGPASTAALGDSTVPSPAGFVTMLLPYHAQRCGPPSCTISFNQWVTILLPCMIRCDVDVWWAWHWAAYTQLETAASEIRTAIFVTGSAGKWSAQQQHTASAELRLWRVCVSPWPCCPVGFIGWIQLDKWSRTAASSSSCPRGDVLDEVVLKHGLSPLWPSFSSPQQTHWIF